MSDKEEAQPQTEAPAPKVIITPTIKYTMIVLSVLLIVVLVSIIVIRYEKKKYENKCQELMTVSAERDEKELRLTEQTSIINQLQKQLTEAKRKPAPSVINAGITIPKVTGPEMTDENTEKPKQITTKQKIKQLVNQSRPTNADLMSQKVDPQDELDKDAENAIKNLVQTETIVNEPEQEIDEELPVLNNIIPSSA